MIEVIGFHTMPINSAGILMYRRSGDGIEISPRPSGWAFLAQT
jgi:hypothetical protein